MAKIIDFSTRSVLADLPVEVVSHGLLTAHRYYGSNPDFADIIVLAENETQAQTLAWLIDHATAKIIIPTPKPSAEMSPALTPSPSKKRKSRAS